MSPFDLPAMKPKLETANSLCLIGFTDLDVNIVARLEDSKTFTRVHCTPRTPTVPSLEEVVPIILHMDGLREKTKVLYSNLPLPSLIVHITLRLKRQIRVPYRLFFPFVL